MQQLEVAGTVVRQHMAIATGQEDRQSRPSAPDLLPQFYPVHARHDYVREHHVEPTGVLLEKPKRGCSVRRPAGCMTKILQHLPGELANLQVILDQQHSG